MKHEEEEAYKTCLPIGMSFIKDKFRNFNTGALCACFPFYNSDTLEIWRFDDENEYEITIDGKRYDSFYSEAYLSGNDKYSVFLDGTHNVTIIRKPNEQRKTLIVAKDSFANCLIPFLAREYDIVALNLRSNYALSFAAEYYSADAVLIVYNMENVMTSADLANIN